jgi:hypothetical protein
MLFDLFALYLNAVVGLNRPREGGVTRFGVALIVHRGMNLLRILKSFV